MRRYPWSRIFRLSPRALSVVLFCSPALAADPAPTGPVEPPSAIKLVQELPPPPIEQPPPTSPTSPARDQLQIQQTAAPSAPAAPAASAGPASTSTPQQTSFGSAGSTASSADRPGSPPVSDVGSNVVSGGQTQALNATDVGSLLGKSISDPGVIIQKRNPIVSDPHIRGYRAGQINTQADGGFWIPARQDLDTIVSKIDSSDIRDIIIIKGPYSVHYGPGFSFLDIVTYDTPRYQTGTEWHGRTTLGYSTNGARWDGRQSVWGGGDDWGVRIGYGIRQGNDYSAGNGYDVPSSYNSQDVNFAIGLNFSPDSKIEFKGMRLDQRNLEFPGLYFDIQKLDTDAYTVRYELKNQDYFDRFNADLWYNYTSAVGNTQQGAKQVFLNTFLASQPGFSPPNPNPGSNYPTPIQAQSLIKDMSSTAFNEMSRGYRMATSWGDSDRIQLTIGTDFNYVNQFLAENIRFQQLSPPNPDVIFPGGVAPVPPVAMQNLGIPASNLTDPGLYLETSVPVTERIKFKGGVRTDQIYTDSTNRFVNGNLALFPATPGGPAAQTGFDPIIFSANQNDPNLTRHMGLFSGYITGEYLANEHLTFLGGFGTAQRPPTLTELYAAGPFINLLQQGLTRIVGDPHLLPERNKQLDVGLKGNYGWFSGGASGFYSWIDNYITYDMVSNVTPFNVVPNNLVGQPSGSSNSIVFTNTDRAILAGGELYGQADITCWLTPFGTLSYVQGRDLTHIDNKRPGLVSSRRTVSQEALPGIPPLQAISGFRIHEPGAAPKWNVEFSARMVAGQNLVATSLDELNTPGFTIFTIRTYWQATENLLLTGGVENFGDKFYREHLDPRSGSPTDVLFQPGTNFYFGAQLQY